MDCHFIIKNKVVISINITMCIDFQIDVRGCRDRDLMVVGFITTYAISVYHH